MSLDRRRPDAIIVGAGIVGAACAEALASDGWRVLVVEQRAVGGGATGAAMGHLVVMDDSPAQLALTARSLQLWRARRDDMPAAVERLDCGTLWLAQDEAELEAVQAKRRAYAAHGVAAEVLDGRALAEAEPGLRANLAGALYVPDDAVIHPPPAARWLLAQAADRGAEVRSGVTVRRITARGVETSEGTLDGGIVIVAAGCGTARLVRALPIAPKKGHLVVTDRHPGLCRHQLVELGYLASAHAVDGPSVAFNLQPRATGQVIVGSSRQLVGDDAAVDREIVRRMVDRAVQFMPALAEASVLRIWTGLRPATADALPLIGRWPALDDVWIAAGHEGLGITTALATAELLADLVVGRPPALDPEPYAPARAMVAAHA